MKRRDLIKQLEKRDLSYHGMEATTIYISEELMRNKSQGTEKLMNDLQKQY